MIDENNNFIILKFKATREKLDWQGNVVEVIENYTYKLENYDPQVFLKSVICKGDLSGVSLLSNYRNPIAFMRLLYDDFAKFEDYHTALSSYKNIESEPFNGSIKFVVYDRANKINMKWVME